ncbi:MAG: response regulator transcription factor, partial [Eubacteriaceae bacterium]
MKIYIVEDDSNIRELVSYTLKHSGFEAEGFGKPSLFWEAFENERPDLLLLDIMLPEEDGLKILEKLRNLRDGEDLPVIMLTAKSSEYDKVVGLENGADDYISKPFGMMELIARIKAVLRRSGVRENHVLTLDGITISPEKHEITASGEPVRLTGKEYELLTYLVENRDIVISR